MLPQLILYTTALPLCFRAVLLERDALVTIWSHP